MPSGVIYSVSDINDYLNKNSFDTNKLETLLLLENMKKNGYIEGDLINHIPCEFYVSRLTKNGKDYFQFFKD